jgi:hypothetical protein
VSTFGNHGSYDEGRFVGGRVGRALHDSDVAFSA